MPSEVKISDEALKALPEHKWTFEGYSEDGTIRYSTFTDPDTGLEFRRKEFLAEDALLAMNKHQYDDSETKRWGDGRVVARIPLSKYFAEIAPHDRVGDADHLKWWLNHEKNRPYRTFKGRV